jgi:hypothetical protein
VLKEEVGSAQSVRKSNRDGVATRHQARGIGWTAAGVGALDKLMTASGGGGALPYF